ncbi:unnamed protein product [Chrysoparadoxa australica]
MTSIESHCTILISGDRAPIQQDEIMADLDQPQIEGKIRGMKNAITLLLQGEPMPRLLMSVIKGCLKEESKELKKLTMIYWEVAKKYDDHGKLLPEMILVCNALRNDLNHPNEYVRGATLRFLCKLREPELLEPLIPTVKACLESHRHNYVRRNAALACYYIHKNFGQQLLPDGPELMERFIEAEGDMGARRNAFLFLFNEVEELAIEYLGRHMDEVSKFGDGFALLLLELCRKVCRRDPLQKSRFVRVLLAMLQSNSPAVSYEAAWTLVSLSSAPTAVRAVAGTYAQLLNSQSDNNVKLIVLDRLAGLKKSHPKVVQEVLMDILRALSSPIVDICRKTLQVAMDLVNPRNIDEVAQVLKREVLRTQESTLEKGSAYRTLLIQAIHNCAAKFPDVAETVVDVLMDFLSGDGAMDVILFVRLIIEQYPAQRPGLLAKLIASVPDMVSSPVLCVCLWILGTYAQEASVWKLAFDELVKTAGEPPFDLESKKFTSHKDTHSLTSSLSLTQELEATAAASEPATMVTKNVVLSDGTYATQTSMSKPVASAALDMGTPALRELIVGGDSFLGTSLISCLTKLTLTGMQSQGESSPEAKAMQVKTLEMLCGVAKLIEKRGAQHPGSYSDCLERITICCKVLLDARSRAMLVPTLQDSCRMSFSSMLEKEKAAASKQAEKLENKPVSQPDDLINFRHLRRPGTNAGDMDIYDGDDIGKATGSSEDDSANKLRHVYQLSGYADPVYAEADVTVHDYDIVLEMLVVNRTPSTLTNLTVELATMGDLRLVERPQSHTIGPLDQRTVRANIKVSSTETGHIFGTIVYENSSTAEKTYINLNDIHLDIMDYIRPSRCSEEAFRTMWAEFEWENKVAINTTFTDLKSFLEHLVESTNTTCLTPTSALDGPSSFLAANLYAVSVFGEDALVNVSVEKKEDADGALCGHVRIRSKTQGIALSLGDRITTVQRAPHASTATAPLQ